MGMGGDRSRGYGGISAWDWYSRTVDEFREKTFFGGLISLISAVLISALIISELIGYLSIERRTEFSVDTEVQDTIKLYIDIDFPEMSCELLGIDVIEINGDMQLGVQNHLYKTSMAVSSNVPNPKHKKEQKPKKTKPFHISSVTMKLPEKYCGSCFGAASSESQCCNTCDDVRKAYEKRGWVLDSVDSIEQCIREGLVSFEKSTEELLNNPDGCNIRGFLEIDKVAGNFHIAPGKTFSVNGVMIHDMSQVQSSLINLKHYIHHFTVGDSYPGRQNPLDGVSKLNSNEEPNGVFEYFLKVVSTKYCRIGWFGRVKTEQKTYQYSIAEYYHQITPNERNRVLPGVYFVYDFSPIAVTLIDTRSSFFHFLVQICAIVGGVFTVARMLDSTVYEGTRFVKKMQIGKSD